MYLGLSTLKENSKLQIISWTMRVALFQNGLIFDFLITFLKKKKTYCNREDIDEFVAIMAKIADECYNEPEKIINAPHNAPCHDIENYYEGDPAKVICSWRQYKKRYGIKE